MKRNEFIKTTAWAALTPGIMDTMNLQNFSKITNELPKQGKRMPVLFTSHGNPMDIPLPREERAFWQRLYDLGKELKRDYEVKAAVVVSAHWLTNHETFVNTSTNQKQIYDYYGFPKHYYDVYYEAEGSPDIAKEIARIIPEVEETEEWGLDHGAWPMLMHLFPDADVPVFQLSIAYHASPEYHFNLGKQLASLREKGVLIIGSGSLIHNLPLAMKKMRSGDMSPYGWEAEYDHWLKQTIEQREFKNMVNYLDSHKLGKLASPTPDHYVPVLYSLGLADRRDEIEFFYEAPVAIPAFSERSFIIKEAA
ncbi:dioxygenase family protein [Jiulongibacter sp. NS-SX5]|uniref:dioxygenase family protein n=1 Tax=Jiulongibacter sp. NS-SX5 TaxID=3463854 RepID=UPI0040585DFE